MGISMRHTKLNVGMVGTNFVSDWMADALHSSQYFSAAAVYSRHEDTGRAFADKHGIARVYTDYSALLDDKSIDVIYIASPNALHYPQGTSALNAGKHVLMEKPLTLNRAQAEALFTLAAEKGLILFEAIRPVYDPFLPIVRESIARIAPVRRAVIEHCKYSSRYDSFKSGTVQNAFDPALGNAALMDIGVYSVHCAVALFGSPKSIAAQSVFLNNGMEALGCALLEYPAMNASVVYSKVTESVFSSVIEGECGSVTFDRLHMPSEVILYPRGDDAVRLPYTPPKNNMVCLLDAFYRCISGEAPPNGQSLCVLSVMDEMRRQTGIDFGEAERV